MAKELEFTGLMDLAQEDTSDVKGIRSPLREEGIYIVNWVSVGMQEAEQTDPDKAPRVNVRFEGVIEYFAPLKESENPEADEAKIGRAYNLFATMFMDDVRQAIGIIKGRYYERARFATAGQMGGIEGVTGWMDAIVGERCGIRVRHSTDKDGNARAYEDWLSPKELKAAGIEWEDMQRVALNPDGSEVEEDKLYR